MFRNRQDFEQLIGQEEAKGLTEDERMTQIAENLQKKFTDKVKSVSIAPFNTCLGSLHV